MSFGQGALEVVKAAVAARCWSFGPLAFNGAELLVLWVAAAIVVWNWQPEVASSGTLVHIAALCFAEMLAMLSMPGAEHTC
jgi:hypothetical protein